MLGEGGGIKMSFCEVMSISIQDKMAEKMNVGNYSVLLEM